MLSVYPELATLSRAAADLIVAEARAAIADHGVFRVVFSGGSTPKRTFELLATDEFRSQIDWTKVHVFWGDERYVQPTDSQSNEHMARAALLDHVEIPAENIHGMYADGGVESAAAAYEALVQAELGEHKTFDLLMLGVGPDGHTASLFPGEPAVHVTDRLVVAGIGHAGVSERITMTPPLLTRAETVLFLVAGADKAAPMARILTGPENWDETPTQAVARYADNVVWMLDQSAQPR